ncbi:YcbK family protein [Pinisolibacter sp.]|uniref:YcbK family protein n=1 Tax=Pinisolibacter sp. TaxID=2172024 RepID=UPI002FDEF251
MTLSRRELLTGLLPFVGLGSSSSAVAAAMPAPAEMPSRLWLVREHDGTEIVTAFRNGAGYDHGAILELSWLWRDNEDGRAIWIEPRLFDALAAIQTGIGRANGALLPLVLTSGCRSPAHNGATEGAARQSTHIDGLAGDIRVSGVEPKIVALAAAMYGAGGVGLYPNHVHVDVWRRRFWVDPKIDVGAALPAAPRPSSGKGNPS